jgi:restriction system protein
LVAFQEHFKMTLWLVRAGQNGEREDFAVEQRVVVLGWDNLPNLAAVASRDEVVDLIRGAIPDAKPQSIANWASQVWMFVGRINLNDNVVLPMKKRAVVAVGKVIGPYEFHPENPEGAKHIRKVQWINEDLPRSAIDQDLLYSLGAFSTVCQLSRNNAAARLLALATGRGAPSPSIAANEVSTDDTIELKQFADDQIRQYITRKFVGHDLARLVNAVLQAQGYHTEMSAPGPDGGVDILAGSGILGFDEPRLCVQVKSGDSPTDVRQIRELDGVMTRFRASRGLFVSWGSYRRGVSEENRREFFRIRLWDSDDLIATITECYDRLPPEIQNELPLEKIWSLVPQEDA